MTYVDQRVDQLYPQIFFEMKPAYWSFVTEMLARPFELYELKTRPQGRASLIYTDARVYADRLDFVVGAQNWELTQVPVTIQDTNSTDVTPQDAPKKDGKFIRKTYQYDTLYYGGIQATMTIFGVSKSDAGNPSMTEQLKGAYSDSMKRAGVVWGIGRYLYGLKDVAAVSERYMPEHALPWEWPDLAGANADLTRQIAKDLKNYTGDKNKVIDLVRMINSTYGTTGPLVYMFHVNNLLTNLSKIVAEGVEENGS